MSAVMCTGSTRQRTTPQAILALGWMLRYHINTITYNQRFSSALLSKLCCSRVVVCVAPTGAWGWTVSRR